MVGQIGLSCTTPSFTLQGNMSEQKIANFSVKFFCILLSMWAMTSIPTSSQLTTCICPKLSEDKLSILKLASYSLITSCSRWKFKQTRLTFHRVLLAAWIYVKLKWLGERMHEIKGFSSSSKMVSIWTWYEKAKKKWEEAHFFFVWIYREEKSLIFICRTHQMKYVSMEQKEKDVLDF